MEDIMCPKCGSTRYRNRELRLMINSCGHSLCDKCVDMLFMRGSGPCPECNEILNKNNFRPQIFDDGVVEKDVDIRKKLLRDFNLQEDDFSSTREYDDYLEEFECIVFNLVNKIDVEETRKKIEAFKVSNKEKIQKNRLRLTKNQEMLMQRLQLERTEEERIRQKFMMEDAMLATQQLQQKEALLLDTDEKDSSQPKKLNGGDKNALFLQEHKIPVPEVPQSEPFLYEKDPFELQGPPMPSNKNLANLGYLKHVYHPSSVEKACGFTAEIPCSRALMDAYSGLFFVQ